MEPPSKRLKLQQALYESDDEANQDELSMTPSQFDARQDPLYQLDKGRAKAATRLKSTFESIFEKYEKDFTGIGDEIDLRTGEIIIDNGHLQSLEDEKDGGREGSVSSDEEERILRGKESRPAKRPHPTSLMPANPSSYNRTPPLDPWKQPATAGANPYGISALPFPLALSMFGNNPTDPAWQAPELPSPFSQNGFGFGFGFGYNPQAPGFPPSLPFDMASTMVTGGGNYGYYGGTARQQGFRRLVSAKSLTRRSLPSIESKESDTDEDDILLAKGQKVVSKPTIAKEAQKTPTPAAFGCQNKIDNQGLKKASATAQDSRKNEEYQTEIRGETESGDIRRGNGLTSTPIKHNQNQSLRHVGRPKKINATTKQQKSDTELSDNIHIARKTKHDNEKTPISQQESEAPRRKPGRPKKSTLAEESQSLQQNTIKNRRPDIDTKAGPHPEVATSKPTAGSAIIISLPVRPIHTSTAPTQVSRDNKETARQIAFDSQRRSSRARKQTEFYGNMKWLKRGVRPSDTSDEEVNQGSESSQTSTSFSQDIIDDQESSSMKYAGSKSSEGSAQLTINNEVLLESDDARTEKEQYIQRHIEMETENGEEVEEVATRFSPPEDGHIENENNDLASAQDSHTLESSVWEKGGTDDAEVAPQTTEAFSRNKLDPSYDFSDCEEEPVRKPVDLADDARAAPRKQQTSGDGTGDFGNTDTSLDRQILPSDVTTNQTPAISDPSEVAKSEPGLDTGSFDANQTSVVSDISDREASQHHSEPPSKTQFTPEPDLPQQEPECQQGLGEPDGQPNTPDRTVTNQARSPTLSPELHIQDSSRESEIASRLSPELGENNAEPEVSAEKSAEKSAEDPDVELAESSKSPEARRPAAVSEVRASIPVTPKKPRRPESGQNGLTSSAKRFALASLVPDGDNDGDGDSDELSIISSSNYYTPRSFRAKLARARRYSASSYSYVSTPRSASRRHGRLVGTPDCPRAPATDSRALLRANRNVLGGGKGRLAATGGDSNVLSSPLARTAAENLLRTPRHNRKRPTSPTESLVQTPGGTIRRCGEDGFVCERDFCFTCCK
ncbi:hypothetical protein F4775DRAFT_416262 [Biscogniauxia sp. FL1348]|nr:hypothetical protein F4775DRAFT_416262 [Biscogniauxia sp. FL1348]